MGSPQCLTGTSGIGGQPLQGPGAEGGLPLLLSNVVHYDMKYIIWIGNIMECREALLVVGRQGCRDQPLRNLGGLSNPELPCTETCFDIIHQDMHPRMAMMEGTTMHLGSARCRSWHIW